MDNAQVKKVRGNLIIVDDDLFAFLARSFPHLNVHFS
jgi:hypothetical protein